MMKAAQIVQKTIKDYGLIEANDHLLLGFSGGPDSLCLLHILASLQESLNFKLYALHVNHQIRGDEADSDMQTAIQVCRNLNIPLTVRCANIPEIARISGMSEEAAGRDIRHKSLQKERDHIAEDNPGSKVKIVLAHNKDDQAETVLMRILRGTGIHGLGAMEHKRADGLIRPLLDTPRSAIEEYCREQNLSPCIDSTNSSSEYTRNKIRLELLPLLEKEFNPNIKECLVRLADSAREDDLFIQNSAQEKLPEFSSLSIPRETLSSMDSSPAKKLICLMFERCGLKQNIGAVHLNSLLEMCRLGRSGTIEFPMGYKAVIQSGVIYFRAPSLPEAPVQEPKPKPVYRLIQKTIPIGQLRSARNLPKNSCALDAVKVLALGKNLEVRTRQPGDRIKPLGMNGTKKIQDFMTDEKIPREKRDSIRLLCCGHAVLWIEGFTVSEICRIDETTKYVLITEIQEEK